MIEAAAHLAPSTGGYGYRLLDVAEVEPPADVARALDSRMAPSPAARSRCRS